MTLNESKFFIAFILKYLGKESDVMIFFQEGFNPIDNGRSPFNDQIFESILLVQIGIHILFHGFTRLLEGFTFLIELDLGRVDVLNNIFQLLKSKTTRLCGSKLTTWFLLGNKLLLKLGIRNQLFCNS